MTKRMVVLLGIVALTCVAYADTYSLKEKPVDDKKIFWGQPDEFGNPGEIKYEEVVVSTPEFQELKKTKVKRGTGKYWILMSQSSDRAIRAIKNVAQDEEYDLVAAEGYLETFDVKPPIVAENITGTVIDEVHGKRKKKKEEEAKKAQEQKAGEEGGEEQAAEEEKSEEGAEEGGTA